MPYDVSPEVLAEDERIRKLQEERDREREEERAAEARQVKWEKEHLKKIHELDLWSRKRQGIRVQPIVRKFMKIDQKRAREEAMESWPEVMQVYRDGLNSKDERHRKACADALREMAQGGKSGTLPPPDSEDKQKLLVVGVLPSIPDEDEIPLAASGGIGALDDEVDDE